MSYFDKVDPILLPWADKNKILVYRFNKDEEIRRFSISKLKKYDVDIVGDEIKIRTYHTQMKKVIKEEKIKLSELEAFLNKLLKDKKD